MRLRRFALFVLVAIAACSRDNPTAPASSCREDAPLPVSTPLAEGIDTTNLSLLVSHAAQQNTEALVVVHNGKVVYENYFGHAVEPIMAMSATNSFVSLGYGLLLAEHKLASLDERVTRLVPSYADVDSRKASTTYRHLLSQTSGIGPGRAGSTDIERYAIQSQALFVPGTGWQYSNNGVDFLAALAGNLAGEPLDQYLRDEIFCPLGITRVTWVRDSRGVPLGAGEMSILPMDLAKVGQTVLDGGRWRGAQIIPPAWIDSSWAPSSSFEPTYGLLWWRTQNGITMGIPDNLLNQWVGNGLSPSITAKLQPLTAGQYKSFSTMYADVAARLTADEYDTLTRLFATGDHVPQYRVLDAVPGFSRYMSGWLGQYLDIVPSKGLVVVRMRRARSSDYVPGAVETDNFPSIFSDVYRLVP
jgi:CubicO group peptidase (beta-lactamase class C family)